MLGGFEDYCKTLAVNSLGFWNIYSILGAWCGCDVMGLILRAKSAVILSVATTFVGRVFSRAPYYNMCRSVNCYQISSFVPFMPDREVGLG